jgi:hypothetical protein
MSSQGLNSTTYSGFRLGATGGVPGGFPMRNSSDYTSFLKQTGLYRGLRGNTGRTDITIVQGNDVRLDYAFGLMGCTGCSGPFPLRTTGT